MAKRGNKRGSILGSIIAIIIIVVIAFFGDELGISEFLTTLATGSVNVENVEGLDNITVTTGNGCITRIPNDSALRVYCLDVGQGDSILISNDNQTMLIDASTNEMAKTVVDDLNRLGVEKIDYLIGTHPHEDHIGGLDEVIKNFDIGKIYMPKVAANTKSYEDVLDNISKKKLKVSSPKIGEKFYVGDAECEIMHVDTREDDLNADSIVIKMECDGVVYLFTGDANYEVENSRDWPDIDILKVGHHGANTRSTNKFLKQITPKIALISCGKNNDYGHPGEKTIERLEKIGATVYRTDEDQTILITQE